MESVQGDGTEAFDEEIAAILAANPTPEATMPVGECRAIEDAAPGLRS